MRTIATLLAFAFTTVFLHAGDDGLAGNWKVVILEDGQLVNPWLVRLEAKAGKLTGEAEGLKGVPETKLNDLKLTGDLIQFELRVAGRISFAFEGRSPRAGAKKILGSVTRDGKSIPAFLEATAAKNGFELDRELVTRTPNDPRVFAAVLDLIREAPNQPPLAKGGKAGVAAQDVQEWVDTSLRLADSYGPKLQLEYTLRLIEALAKQKDYAALSAGVAEKAETLLDPKAPPATQLQFLSTLSSALMSTAAPAKLKAMEARIEKLEESAFVDYSKSALDFKPAEFKGRKTKGERAVLVELFTGAMCPPCVAADLAFDALEKAFPARDVVLLQYHLHIPGPDALTNADAVQRSEYYGRTLRGTPTIYFNGKADKNVQGGGGREDAEDKYKEYRNVLESLLEKPAGAQLQLKAARQGDKIAIQASVKDVDKPGETTRLRLALVEDWVRYKARNGQLYHHRVVRALPGGAAGLAVMKKDVEQSVTVDLGAVRAGLTKYLDDFAKNETAFPDAQRPMRFKNLRVVAFVQNDETNEVLQAVDVAVTED